MAACGDACIVEGSFCCVCQELDGLYEETTAASLSGISASLQAEALEESFKTPLVQFTQLEQQFEHLVTAHFLPMQLTVFSKFSCKSGGLGCPLPAGSLMGEGNPPSSVGDMNGGGHERRLGSHSVLCSN